jgi:hypothetical protein
MTQKTTVLVLAVALCLLLVASAGWYQARVALRGARAGGDLQQIATLLQDDQSIIRQLQLPQYAEPDSGILGAYLAKIRRDGVAKHADMKQLLDQLADNNAAIVGLIKAYVPHAQTPAFTAEADQFRVYAAAWRDRWNSVMEIFMAGGNYPASLAPFPIHFYESVQAEIRAAR